MNKRIEELYKQALNPDFDGDDGAMHELNVKKFAELIIRDCGNAIQAEIECGLYNEQQMSGMTVSQAVINNHFGVGE